MSGRLLKYAFAAGAPRTNGFGPPVIGKRVLLITAIALLWCSAALADPAGSFPRPSELEPDILFWTRVYTQVDSHGGLIHDDSHLGVVYEVLRFPEGAERRTQRRLVKAAKQRYQDILLRLAKGERENLTADELRVLALWPEGVSNKALYAAAKRLRFQLGQSDKFKAGLARSGIWEAHIREILSGMGLPVELVALPHVESSFNPNARSRVGAAGLWQFTRSTGRRFMRIDRSVDERMDPYFSTVAAAKLLSHNYSATGSWPLAITSYNHGTAGVRRAVQTLGTRDITRIVREYESRSFGFASRNFYVAFLAAVEIHFNPEKYFDAISRHSPAPTRLVRVPGRVSVDTLRRVLGVDEDALRENNPALLPAVWRGARHVPRGFELRIPASAASEEMLAALSQINEDDRAARVPSATPAPTRPEPVVVAEKGQYTVRRGDSLWLIARRLGISEESLLSLNDLGDGEIIRVGQVLRVEPEMPQPVAVAAAGAGHPTSAGRASDSTEIGEEARPEHVSDRLIARIEKAEPASAEEAEEITPALLPTIQPDLVADPSDYSVAADGSIEVQAAETLGHYADWLELRAGQLRQMNGMRYRQPVVIGQRLSLNFSRVKASDFERRRTAYHRGLQESFFKRYRIAGTSTHVVRQAESVWILARRKYGVPIWLLRQYNPDRDLDAVAIGATITIPRVEPLDEPLPAANPAAARS